jgi:hypothetical protein
MWLEDRDDFGERIFLPDCCVFSKHPSRFCLTPKLKNDHFFERAVRDSLLGPADACTGVALLGKGMECSNVSVNWTSDRSEASLTP